MSAESLEIEERLALSSAVVGQLRALADDFRTEAIERGFLGPHEAARMWTRHIRDALALALIERPVAGQRWADLGAGAGIPGLPLALAFPGTVFVLIDAQRKRTVWAREVARRHRLDNVEIVHARLEDLGRGPARETFNVAVARALGPLPVVAELGLPLLRTGGRLLVPRGHPPPEELAATRRACAVLGADPPQAVHNPAGESVDPPDLVIIMTKAARTPRAFPRRPGEPERSPLGAQRQSD